MFFKVFLKRGFCFEKKCYCKPNFTGKYCHISYLDLMNINYHYEELSIFIRN